MPHRNISGRNRRFAKTMRQEMTKAELRLWLRLRKPGLPGLRFRRQTPIGPFIVDFFCPEQKLIVEVDGDQHGFPAAGQRDGDRDAWLRKQGYRVLRFWNREIMTNIDGVCSGILATVEKCEAGTDPLPKPAQPVSTSPQGGGWRSA